LALHTTAIDDVHFFGPFDALGQAQAAPVFTGLTQPFATRPLGMERPAMRLHLHDVGRYSVYMRLHSSTSQSLAVTAWDTGTYVQWRQHKRLFDGVVYGVLLALLLYNLSLFYVLRDRSYGFYVATGLAALFTLSSFNGHAAQYLLGPWPWLQASGNVLGSALWITLGAQFCRSFLDAGKHLPRWDKVLQAVMAGGLVATALALLGRISLAQSVLEVLASVGTVAAVWAAVLALRAGFRPATWYLAGQAMLFLSALGVVAGNWGLFDAPFLAANGLQLGTMAEMVVFAFALSARIRTMRERQHELRQRADVLAEAAATDPLTGLSNRVGLAEHAQRVLRRGEPCALMLLDLDRFKPINDTHGHEAGDRVLEAVARRLQQLMREGDGVARLGGDEFVVMLSGPQGRERLATVAQRLGEAVRQPVNYRGQALSVGVSIGIARCPEQGQTLTELMRHADEAMYRAKQARSGHAFYEPPAPGTGATG
jgi:diguanylate cyclase (GGDEF)-like protein